MKYLFMAALSLFSTLSFAQSKKFTFKLGTEYELPRKAEDLSFFGNDKDGIINMGLKKEELTILMSDSRPGSTNRLQGDTRAGLCGPVRRRRSSEPLVH